MSRLTVFSATKPTDKLQELDNATAIQQTLEEVGVQFSRWHTQDTIQAGAEPELVLQAYQEQIAELCARGGYQTVDVISLGPDAENIPQLRQKFLSEHTHSEDEVRFFVAGSGLFSLHIGQHVYEILCERNDLIAVPANTPHWFDMGPKPDFIAIRFFNNPSGWVAHYTGDKIADRFSRFTDYVIS